LLALGATQVLCAVLVEKALSAPKPISADFVGLLAAFCVPRRFALRKQRFGRLQRTAHFI